MKADGNVTINGGNISVTTTGNGAEGIESKAVLTVSDGTLVVNSYDDGLNSSSHMYIKGGDITLEVGNFRVSDLEPHIYKRWRHNGCRIRQRRNRLQRQPVYQRRCYQGVRHICPRVWH